MPDMCRFWLGWDGWKKFTVVLKVVQVSMVMASDGGYFPVFEDLSFGFLAYNEVLSEVNSVRSLFGHADLAPEAFIEDKTVPGCGEAALKLKWHRESSPWYRVSVRRCQFACRRGGYSVL